MTLFSHLILLILRDQVVHVGLSFRELHLIHTFTRVPMQEGLTPEHRLGSTTWQQLGKQQLGSSLAAGGRWFFVLVKSQGLFRRISSFALVRSIFWPRCEVSNPCMIVGAKKTLNIMWYTKPIKLSCSSKLLNIPRTTSKPPTVFKTCGSFEHLSNYLRVDIYSTLKPF